MIGFSKMLTRVEKYVCAEESYEVHGPPPDPTVKEQPLA